VNSSAERPGGGQRIIGIDYGSVRMGLAMSDETRTIAGGLEVYRRRGEAQDIAHLAAIVVQHAAELVVLGLPYNMDGSLGPKAEEVLRFKSALERAIPCPVVTIDERLTTVEAERVLLEGDLSRAKRRDLRDQVAAVLILQHYLDRADAGG
jgi:putative pre-16S rRNA nuclease